MYAPQNGCVAAPAVSHTHSQCSAIAIVSIVINMCKNAIKDLMTQTIIHLLYITNVTDFQISIIWEKVKNF
jgi:hypothetical protein